MNSTTDRKVVIALLTVIAVCLLGFGTSLYRAKARELKDLRVALREKTAERDEVKAKIARMPELEEKYAQLQERLAVLEPTLPNSAYIPTFLRQIENLAVGTDNRIMSIRPRPEIEPGKPQDNQVRINNETGEPMQEKPAEGEAPKPAAEQPKLPYRFIPIEWKMEGTYWTTVDFLRDLQRFPKMIAVNSVGFAPVQMTAGAGDRQKLVTTMDMLAVVTAPKGDAHGTSQSR